MSFITGFSQGLAESVQTAIEKEQKSMDDMFQTQFAVRLKRRMNDLTKDRDNLAEASERIRQYSAYTGGDLYKAGQLYQTAGGNHDDFTKRLRTLKNEGTDPYSVFKFAQDNGLDYIPTMDQVARAVTTAPTALPFTEDLPAYGGLMGKITSMFGRDADASPYVTRQTQRMQQQLEAIAPMPTASTLTLAPLEMAINPETGKSFHLQTKEEVTAQDTREAQALLAKTSADFARNTLGDRQLAVKMGAGKAEIEYNIAKATEDASINYFKDRANLMQAQSNSENLQLNILQQFGVQEAQARLDVVLATLEEKKNPRDFEKAYMAFFHERMKIERRLAQDNMMPIYDRQRLNKISRSLIEKENSILALQAQFDPATPTDPYKHFTGISSSYHKTVMHHIGKSTLAGNNNVVFTPSGDGKIMIPAFRGSDPKAQKLFLEIINGAKRTFYTAHVLGVDDNGNVQYKSEAGKTAIIQNVGKDFMSVLERETKYKKRYPTISSYSNNILADPRFIASITKNNVLDESSVGYQVGVSDLVKIYSMDEEDAKTKINDVYKMAIQQQQPAPGL